MKSSHSTATHQKPFPPEQGGRQILEKIMKTPEVVLDKIDLVYVREEEFPITRKRKGKGFAYYKAGKHLKNKSHLKRIKELVLPPAWSDVRISEKQNGHLQAVGTDARGRRQYRYHSKWSAIRNQSKFYKMTAFGNRLPSIRRKVRRDLRQKGWSKTRVLALVVSLLEKTRIRIGGIKYAEDNDSYGLITLRKKHVKHGKGVITFEFPGKKGVDQTVDLTDKRLIKLVCKCEEIPGWELFKYYEADGEKETIDSGMVNEYLKDISGDFFTAKDFRTWWGSHIFFMEVIQSGPVADAEAQKDIIRAALKEVARALGNTVPVCRTYYVHPALMEIPERGLSEKLRKQVKRHRDSRYMRASEKVMHKYLKKYHKQADNLENF